MKLVLVRVLVAASAIAVSSCASAFVPSNKAAMVAIDAVPDYPDTVLEMATLQFKILHDREPFAPEIEASYQDLLTRLNASPKIAYFEADAEGELTAQMGTILYTGDYDDGEGTTGHIVLGSTPASYALLFGTGGKGVSLFLVPRQ